jgi:hypothetical protein
MGAMRRTSLALTVAVVVAAMVAGAALSSGVAWAGAACFSSTDDPNKVPVMVTNDDSAACGTITRPEPKQGPPSTPMSPEDAALKAAEPLFGG